MTTGVKGRSRVSKGVPTGGEFATERKTKKFGTTDDTKQVMAGLKKAVANINTSDDWKKALSVFSNLHQYSFLNSVWLYRQNPGVTAVASYKKWEEQGIHVNKGEKAMHVLGPLVVTDRDAPPDANGKYPQKVIRFKAMPVFDLSQTDAYGKLDTMSGRWTKAMQQEGIAPEGMTEALTEKANKLGFTVSYQDDFPGTAAGVTRFGSHEIVVKSSLSDLKRAQVLSHELGHIIMGHGDKLHDYHSGAGGERPFMEAEAEAAAYVIAMNWGIVDDEDNTQTFEYIAGWASKNNDDTDNLLTKITNKLTAVRHELPLKH